MECVCVHTCVCFHRGVFTISLTRTSYASLSCTYSYQLTNILLQEVQVILRSSVDMLTFYQEVLSETIFRGHHTSKIDSSLLMRSNASPLASEEALRFF